MREIEAETKERRGKLKLGKIVTPQMHGRQPEKPHGMKPHDCR